VRECLRVFIVEKRLAKERGKYKDYDELKSKAMKLDEMENAGKSEIDKLKESNAALRKQIDHDDLSFRMVGLFA